MTDGRPQAMALQNSITLDKKFGIEISILVKQDWCGLTWPDCCYCATILLTICQFSIFVFVVKYRGVDASVL